jgi:hypothetical protein
MPTLTLRGPVPPQVEAARWRFRWEPTPMIAEAMTAHANERAAVRKHGSWSPQIRAAAETLNQVRLEFVAAALDFEREDTPDTRRAVAECE